MTLSILKPLNALNAGGYGDMDGFSPFWVFHWGYSSLAGYGLESIGSPLFFQID